MNGLLTNNHVIDQELLKNLNKIPLILTNQKGEEKHYNLHIKDARKWTDKELDYTFIEYLDNNIHKDQNNNLSETINFINTFDHIDKNQTIGKSLF